MIFLSTETATECSGTFRFFMRLNCLAQRRDKWTFFIFEITIHDHSTESL
jgi:hypothetical protein